MNRIAVVIIVRNEARCLQRCLDSARPEADEMWVLDTGSTDATVQIALRCGARVGHFRWCDDFAAARNAALSMTNAEWCVVLDADEWITPALRDEMRAVMADPAAAPAYAVPRSSSFCGRTMKHSGWWPDYVVRLFKRDAARFSDDQAHERLVVTGATRKLKQPLLHEAISNMDQMLGKMNLYSSASARMLHTRGRRASIGTALLHGGWAFFRTYVLRLGFLDGREGFILAVANAEGSYYRYIKLMLLSGEKK